MRYLPRQTLSRRAVSAWKRGCVDAAGAPTLQPASRKENVLCLTYDGKRFGLVP